MNETTGPLHAAVRLLGRVTEQHARVSGQLAGGALEGVEHLVSLINLMADTLEGIAEGEDSPFAAADMPAVREAIASARRTADAELQRARERAADVHTFAALARVDPALRP